MGHHIIETLGKWGVKTSPADYHRFRTPHAGDIVEFPEHLRKYPVKHRLCRIERVDDDTKTAHIVDGMGSAFIDDDGNLSISGGPFFSLRLDQLDPKHSIHATRVWNWGDHLPGADQGVDYTIERPVFTALSHPD